MAWMRCNTRLHIHACVSVGMNFDTFTGKGRKLIHHQYHAAFIEQLGKATLKMKYAKHFRMVLTAYFEICLVISFDLL